MIQQGNWGNYRGTINVNNQLGTLHDIIKQYLPHEEIKCEPFSLTYNSDLQIYQCNTAIPLDLAKEVRQFINKVKIDLTIPHLNDTNNKPLDNALNFNSISLLYQENPNDWNWVNYGTYDQSSIFRLTPSHMDAFFNSPIKRLIDLIEAKWLKTQIPNIEMLLLKKITWVIQLVPPGYIIDWHTDAASQRKISFIYYLTDDNWNIEKDGGALQIEKNGQITKLTPLFNTMLMWPMVDNIGPNHSVDKVLADITKPRISLVGFYYGDN